MKYGLYVIYDNVAKESGFPFDAKNDGVALRKFESFLDSLAKRNDKLNFEEYELHCIAEYDSESMVITRITKDQSCPRQVDVESIFEKVDLKEV